VREREPSDHQNPKLNKEHHPPIKNTPETWSVLLSCKQLNETMKTSSEISLMYLSGSSTAK